MEPVPVTRRRFFVDGLLGVAALLGAGALLTRFIQYLSPPAPPEREVEIPAIRLEAIPDGDGTVVPLPSGHIALERRGQQVLAYSAVCTHLGCIVQWRPSGSRAWYCPCHHGTYDRMGRVLSGPPPRPLVAVPAVVRDGQVFVRVTVRAKDQSA